MKDKELTPQEKINIYKDLFRGREDVFAMRWEKADKSASGYTPVCINEWRPRICLKLRKGKCKDCQNKNYTSLNDDYIKQHLRGNRVYGIYPLLNDNTSYFIVIDFDGEKNWIKDTKSFIKKCTYYKLNTYLERSRSGKGGHVWLFFENKYPAYKSRNIISNILRKSKIVDQFEREDSFDRIFPNQDSLSGKGFGNLIVLPLQGQSSQYGNTVFLNLEDMKPFENQWSCLNQTKKVSVELLDKLYEQFNKKIRMVANYKQQVVITIGEYLYINKNNFPKLLVSFLKEKLNFINSDFLIKQRMGLSVYKLEKYFKLIENIGNSVAIPRGFLNKLVEFLNDNNIKFKLVEKRAKPKSIALECSCQLFDYQKEALDELITVENGILVAPPASGKTVMGLALIAQLKLPTLIIVHRRQIFNQWIKRIEDFLGIPKREIGQFSSYKKKMGAKITVAMVQTLNKIENSQKINHENIGLVIVDECHHMPARMFRQAITQLKPYYLYGLTATPIRKNNDEKLIFIYLGDIIYEVSKEKQLTSGVRKENLEIVVRKTCLTIPFEFKIDNFQMLSKVVIFDSNRNQLISKDVAKEVSRGKKCLILTERKEHVELLDYYLKRDFTTITMSGELTAKQKRERVIQIQDGNFQIIIATGQLLGEGTDFNNLDCLFLVYPFAFKGKLIQYIGRVEHGKSKIKTIYDYRDEKIEFLEKMFQKRERYYKKVRKKD